MKDIVLLVLFFGGLSSARYLGLPYDNNNIGYTESLPPRVTSLTMHFPLGNPFRPGENFVDLGRTGPYYLGNGYRGYTFYPTTGISDTYNRMFGGQDPFTDFSGGNLGLGGTFGRGLFGGNFGGGLMRGNFGGLLGRNLGGSLLTGNLGGKFG